MIATVAAGFFGLDILLLLSFQVLNRDYGVFTHAVSDYGVGKTAGLFRAYVTIASLAVPLLACCSGNRGCQSIQPRSRSICC